MSFQILPDKPGEMKNFHRQKYIIFKTHKAAIHVRKTYIIHILQPLSGRGLHHFSENQCAKLEQLSHRTELSSQHFSPQAHYLTSRISKICWESGSCENYSE